MEIIKILNNNVAVVHDALGYEQVVMGRGIAYQRRVGDAIAPEAIDKVFSLQSHKMRGLSGEMLTVTPRDVVTISEYIIHLAREELSTPLHESLAVSLTDHIHFAVYRHHHKLKMPSGLQWEIRCLYPKEYDTGLKALDIIERRSGVRLDEDEAGLIALHLVNAQLHCDMPEVLLITRFMQEILDRAKAHLQIEYQVNSLTYNRFVTHLKFFARRMFGKKDVGCEDAELQDVVRKHYPESCRCVEEIERYISQHYNYLLGGEERMFLTIHIERVRKEALRGSELDDEG